jgi:hypothetical protein
MGKNTNALRGFVGKPLGRTRTRCGIIIKTVLTEIVINEDSNEPLISIKHG